MTKTLKDFFEVYRPKSPDEQKFVDKHVTIKHKDRNGNDDDVFNASNVKTIKRKEENHGYDSGEDEKVYEEVEDLDESVAKVAIHLIKRYGENVRKSHVRSAANDFGVGFVALSHHVRKKLGVNRLEEDVEELDELSKGKLASYINKAEDSADDLERKAIKGDDKSWRKMHKRLDSTLKAKHKWIKANEEVEEIEEKKLTPAEMKKREQIAKAMERENPGMDKSKKMAIATATAKRVAEEAEELDEISAKKLTDYTAAASDARGHRKLSTAKLDKRYAGVALAHEKIRARHAKVAATNEEVEDLEELSKSTLGSYTYKATKDVGDKGVTAGLKIQNSEPAGKELNKMGRRMRGVAMAVKKMTKEQVINNAIDKFMPELEDYVPMAQEEKLVAKLDGLSESHTLTLLSLFDSLNEDNRTKMLMMIDTREGINSLLDFALQNNRGE